MRSFCPATCAQRLYMLAATPHVTMCAQHDMLTLPSSPAFIHNCGLLMLLQTTRKKGSKNPQKNARVANTLSGKSRNEAFPPSWAAGSLWWVAGWVPEKQGVCYCTLSPLSSPFPVGSLTSRPRTPFQILSTCCGPPNKKLTCQKKEIGFQWN